MKLSRRLGPRIPRVVASDEARDSHQRPDGAPWGQLVAWMVPGAGDVVVLTGELGAGKTTFARGFGEALDLDTPVSSPTFIVARTHRSIDPEIASTGPCGCLSRWAPQLSLMSSIIDVEGSISVV